MTASSAKLFTDKNPSINCGLYHVNITIGNAGMPGAPVVNLSLAVQASSGHVSGLAEIEQSLHQGPGLHRFPVSGHIYQTGYGKNEQLVSLDGRFVVSVPPPGIGTYLAEFSASLAVDQAWSGHGGFDYMHNHVERVPVNRVE